MSPKFYGFLWMVYGGTAGILFLGGVFTLLTGVVYGFAGFGMIFLGIMCVLPGTVSHHPDEPKVGRVAKKAPKQAHRPSGFSAARSA
ncbi:hypothetical protein BH10ACI3_BH10ACI3_03410 [soil metagenome]